MELPLDTELRVGFITGLTSPEAAQATARLAEGLGYDSVFGVGVGVGGEFPLEYAACGVRVEERGARLSETIPLLKRLWSDEPVQHAGRFWSFPSVRMLPAPAQPGGPLFPQILPHPIPQEGPRCAQGPEPPDPSSMNSILQGVRAYMGGRPRHARA